MKKTLILLMFGIAPFIIFAQQDSSKLNNAENLENRMYNPETLTTVSGVVTKVLKTIPENKMQSGVHIFIQEGDENIEVHLGPEWYLNENGISLKENDQVSVKGSKVEMSGEKVIIASHLTMGTKEVRLRSEDGIPLWSRKNMGKNKKNK